MKPVLRRAALAALALAAAAFLPTHRVVLVAGGSMAPALEAGDLAVVRRGAAVRTGDVVLFRLPSRGLVLHRLVARGRGGWLTRGDANPVGDRDPVPASALQGRVVGVVRSGRAAREASAAAGDVLRACAKISAQSHSEGDDGDARGP